MRTIHLAGWIAFSALLGWTASGFTAPAEAVHADAGGAPAQMVVGTAGTSPNLQDLLYVVKETNTGETQLALYRVSGKDLTIVAMRDITWDLQIDSFGLSDRQGSDNPKTGWSLKAVKQALDNQKKNGQN